LTLADMLHVRLFAIRLTLAQSRLWFLVQNLVFALVFAVAADWLLGGAPMWVRCLTGAGIAVVVVAWTTVRRIRRRWWFS
jgi:hypothetical protein